jgi:hypothetical protein
MSTAVPTAEECYETLKGVLNNMQGEVKASPAASMEETLEHMNKKFASLEVPVIGNVFEWALLTISGLSQDQQDAVKAWKQNKRQAEKCATQQKMKLNRLRSSTRLVNYPKPMVDALDLGRASVLPWNGRFLGSTGYLDRIRRSDVGNNRILKGVDCVKRPFVVFLDKEDRVCVLFQRYEPGNTRDLAGKDPLWVGVPREREVFQDGWHAFPVSKMDQFATRIAKHVDVSQSITSFALGKRGRE